MMLSKMNYDLVICKVFYFFFFAAFGSLFPLLGVYFKQLGMTPTQTGVIVGFRPFIEFVSSPWWGGIADRFRMGKHLLLISMSCWIAFTLAMGFVQTPPVGCVKYNGSDFLMVDPWFDSEEDYPLQDEFEPVTMPGVVDFNVWERKPMDMSGNADGNARKRMWHSPYRKALQGTNPAEGHASDAQEISKRVMETPDIYSAINDTHYVVVSAVIKKEDIPLGEAVPPLLELDEFVTSGPEIDMDVDDDAIMSRVRRGAGGGNYFLIPKKHRKPTTPVNKFRPHEHFENYLPPPEIQVIGQSPVPLDWRGIVNVNRDEARGLVSPPWSTIVYRSTDVYEIFLILLLLVIIGEFFSAPAINLADAATIGYLGDDVEKYGRQRLFGSLGWALSMFFVGIALDHSNMFPNHPCGNTRAGEKNYTVCFAVFTVSMVIALATATQFRFEYDGVKENIQLGDIKKKVTKKVQDTISKHRGFGRERLVEEEDDDWRGFTKEERGDSGMKNMNGPGTENCDIKITLQTDAGVTSDAPPPQPSQKVVNSPYVPRGSPGQSGTMPGWMTVLRTLGNPHYGAVLFLTWFFGFGIGLNFTFLFWHLQDIGGGPTLFGISSVITHVCEILSFVICKRLIGALGHVKVLYLGLLSNIVRFLIISWLRNPWWVIPFEFLQGVTHATVWAAICSYVTQAIPEHLRASAQTILQGIHHGLGRGCGALIGGCLAGAYGTEMTFRGYGITCVVILILYTALTYAFRGQSQLGPPPEDRHEILEESSHLAPCGVPMSPMSRALSSEPIDRDASAANGYGTNSAPTAGGYLDPNTGQYIPGHPPNHDSGGNYPSGGYGYHMESVTSPKALLRKSPKNARNTDVIRSQFKAFDDATQELYRQKPRAQALKIPEVPIPSTNPRMLQPVPRDLVLSDYEDEDWF